mgnify:CR=1 FL=1
MATASAYLLNTLPTIDRWHLKSTACQHKYFAKEGIKLNVLDKNHYLIRPILNKPIQPMCRKIIRLYDFLDSGDDYGVFMDLDTIVINGKKSIHDFLVDGQSYIRNALREASRYDDTDWKDLPYFLKTRACIHQVLKNALSLDYDIDRLKTVNTGFSIISRELCELILNQLEELELDLTKKSGVNNYIELDSEVQRLYEDRGWAKSIPTIQDEHLLEIVLNSADRQNNPIKKLKPATHICTEAFEIRIPDPDSKCFFDMSKLSQKDTIFLHLIACFDADALDGIFKIAGDF